MQTRLETDTVSTTPRIRKHQRASAITEVPDTLLHHQCPPPPPLPQPLDGGILRDSFSKKQYIKPLQCPRERGTRKKHFCIGLFFHTQNPYPTSRLTSQTRSFHVSKAKKKKGTAYINTHTHTHTDLQDGECGNRSISYLIAAQVQVQIRTEK